MNSKTYSRSNFFRVSDVEKAKEIAKKTNSEIIEEHGRISFIYSGNQDSNGCVDFYYDKNLDEFLTIHEEIQEILLEKEQAIFIEYDCTDIATFIMSATMVTTEAIISAENERVTLMDVISTRFRDYL